MRSLDISRAAVLQAFAIGLAYAALASWAIELTRLSGGIALLWLANAPLITALTASSRRRWPLLILASFTATTSATLIFSPFASVALAFAFANIGEAVLAAVLLRHWGVARTALGSAASIGLFVVSAVIVAPFAGGLMLTGSIHFFLPLDFGSTLFDWQLGHGIGNLIGVPFGLMTVRRDVDWRRFHARRGSWVAAGCVVVLAGTTAAVFGQTSLPLLFLPIAPLLLATFQLQRFGAAGGVLIIAVIGGVATLHGSGPIMLMPLSEAARLQFLQFYIAVLFATAMPVSAALWQREKLSRALAESEARYRLLADNATDIMLTLDPDGTIRFASPAVRELGHFDPDALVGRNAVTLVYEEDRAVVGATHRDAIASPERTFSVEYRAVRGDGSIGWYETNTRAVRDTSGQVGAVISVIRDLDERKARETELYRAATTDGLTGLLNRGAFRRLASEAMVQVRRGTPSTLAILDLDHFKAINDTHGHAAGDDALLMVADLLTDHVRAGDAVGRVGGEEFAVLFRGLALGDAAPICERLRLLLSERRLGPHREIGVTMSAGLAELCPGFGLDAVFQAADGALYRAKADGRNRIAITRDLLAL